ncbi:MAG: hypothetical protein LBC77_06595 [Spirochaetaceae bacterium]|jgi:hypothetical protein|nr:hypothetical protein [Spirochaetaceae bacterium]
MSNEHIATHNINTRFSSTNQPAKRGRLPSKLKKFCKENEVSKSDLDKLFKNLIFGKSINELQEMIKLPQKDNLPVMVVLLISAFISDMKNGTLKEVNTVLDRIYGKSAQKDVVEVSVIKPETTALLEEVFGCAD